MRLVEIWQLADGSGELPSNWHYVPLGNVARYINGRARMGRHGTSYNKDTESNAKYYF